MAETIAEITTFKNDGNSLSIKVTAEEDTRSDGTVVVPFLKVTLEADGVLVGEIKFDPTKNKLILSGMALSGSGYTSCLVACGLGHLVSDILDCRHRGKTSVTDLIACLKNKGHRLTLKLVNCAVACLPAAVAP